MRIERLRDPPDCEHALDALQGGWRRDDVIDAADDAPQGGWRRRELAPPAGLVDAPPPPAARVDLVDAVALARAARAGDRARAAALLSADPHLANTPLPGGSRADCHYIDGLVCR